jgi:hypothetical protein
LTAAVTPPPVHRVRPRRCGLARPRRSSRYAAGKPDLASGFFTAADMMVPESVAVLPFANLGGNPALSGIGNRCGYSLLASARLERG